MQAPPFRLAAAVNGAERTDAYIGDRMRTPDACCAPSPGQLQSLKRRPRLSELDSHLHCSIIGTCLTTHELRKLVPKFTRLDRQKATDLEIHHAAIELAIEGGAGGKALHKALDERYAGALRRFDSAKDADALLALWNDALKSGDIPPAYWALMTHPQATLPVRQAAFGELHMLSHLVGAANRADIRRLVALEEQNAQLHAKMERQQQRLHEMALERDTLARGVDELNAQLAARSVPADTAQRAADADRLREALAARDARLALQTSRCDAAEQRVATEQENVRLLRASLDDALALLKVIQDEANALERTVQAAANDTSSSPASAAKSGALDALQGKRIVYVGGRPGSNSAVRRLVEAAGGELTVHDGGIEDRKGLLAAALPNADMVVFPVDCIDHDSMNMLKRVCERSQVAYYPLRTASVASFVELVARLTAADAPAPAARVSRFCLRHG
ncbi:DUF2325 domain-containing protein [Paraburkholderia solisilvae]|uniref:Uncharacterized protein n=1 Tax=Paraburkholderia solisilvae TaxID=624376 RepID=A0A6J5DPT2_9BURK|nr:DUF2325 domain-containing protein [Paraburkholderia solisilvae]CAB3755557.1 hypothetical protein LMG29739_02201 [Paraburkholderia solisilvae]